MENKLKKLEEHNSEARKFHLQMNGNDPTPNGIECPNCQHELLDSNPMMTLTSFPPQKNIHCSNCGYKGYRVC